jgi:hypothetical protein
MPLTEVLITSEGLLVAAVGRMGSRRAGLRQLELRHGSSPEGLPPSPPAPRMLFTVFSLPGRLAGPATSPHPEAGSVDAPPSLASVVAPAPATACWGSGRSSRRIRGYRWPRLQREAAGWNGFTRCPRLGMACIGAKFGCGLEAGRAAPAGAPPRLKPGRAPARATWARRGCAPPSSPFSEVREVRQAHAHLEAGSADALRCSVGGGRLHLRRVVGLRCGRRGASAAHRWPRFQPETAGWTGFIGCCFLGTACFERRRPCSRRRRASRAGCLLQHGQRASACPHHRPSCILPFPPETALPNSALHRTAFGRR